MTLEEALQHGIADQTGVFIEAYLDGQYSVTCEDGRGGCECRTLPDVHRYLAAHFPELNPTGWGWFKPISATSIQGNS